MVQNFLLCTMIFQLSDLYKHKEFSVIHEAVVFFVTLDFKKKNHLKVYYTFCICQCQDSIAAWSIF